MEELNREDKIEILYDYVQLQNKRYDALRELYGSDHDVVTTKGWMLIGMEMAFKAIAGHSVTEHMLIYRKEQRK